MNYYNIPERLRGPKSTVYCCHKDKVPTHGTKPNDLHTFFSFDKALEIMQPDEGLGVGMWGYLCGIDIDHCIDENGVISDEALAIIDYFDSYAEASVSGTGVHILFLCKDQYKDKNTYYIKLGKKHMKEKSISGMEGLEFYQGLHDHRYLTLTGNKIHDMNTEWVDGTKVLSFLEKYFKRPPVVGISVTTTSSDAEDKAWMKWALLERKPKKLYDCWFKMPTGSGGTESEDDLIFMSELAFWSNKNPNVMRLTFEASRYYKSKDDKHLRKWARQDYSEGVINKAMSSGNVVKEFFADSFYYDDTDNKIKEVQNDNKGKDRTY